MAESNLKEQLIKRYGAKEGMRIYLAIVPGILADFKKILKDGGIKFAKRILDFN